MYAPWIAAAFLFIALVPDLPYGYYQILRWVVCACSCFGAFIAMEREKMEKNLPTIECTRF